MVFAIECIVACILFTLALELVAHNRQEVFINDSPPIVTDKLRALGLVSEKPPARKSDIIRKVIAIPVYSVLFGLLLRFVNGITTFTEAALLSYFMIPHSPFVFSFGLSGGRRPAYPESE